jgi:hypothetical protein
MWTLLDADADHHVHAEEFTAQGMDGDLMVKWLETYSSPDGFI